MVNVRRILRVTFCLVLMAGSLAQANWSETFNNNAFDLATWQFLSYPQITGTFSGTIQPGADGNDYLALAETSSLGVGGSAFGIALGSTEQFADVRIGALVNIDGTAHSYHGLAARTSYFMDDGSASGAPGVVASTYLMLVHYQEGPANLRIEVFKTINLDESIMKTFHEITVPGVGNARSYYAELDVVGADPVYITGSLYEFKGGPLLARTPTLIDTSGTDAWENEGFPGAVFAKGASAVFSMNKDATPIGYRGTFDDVFSASDGPAAVRPYPADGATEVSPESTLDWVEAAFATSRQLWFGRAGAMQLIETAPEAAQFDPGPLDRNQAYQWRVDQVGPGGTVEGHVWTFTTADGLTVDDFETYASDAEIAATWVHNIPGGYDYVFRETGSVQHGARAMRLNYQNQYEPFVTEATRTFETPQDWTRYGVATLSLAYRGAVDNLAQPMFVRLQDAAGATATVTQPYDYAVQSKFWRSWDLDLRQFSDAGVDLTTITQLVLGVGRGIDSGQATDDLDTLIIDHIQLKWPAATGRPSN